MSEMIERVRLAIEREFSRQKFHVSAGPLIWGSAIIDTASISRVAIEAMREPTEAMERAGDAYMADAAFAATPYQAMIDAALGR